MPIRKKILFSFLAILFLSAFSFAPKALAGSFGGLVPCGRLADDPGTPWNDTAPCNLCFIFQLIYNVTDYAVKISFALAVFMMVIGGLVYAFSVGSMDRIELAKKIILLALRGLIIIFAAWVIVAIVLALLGYTHPFSGNWNVVNCALPS